MKINDLLPPPPPTPPSPPGAPQIDGEAPLPSASPSASSASPASPELDSVTRDAPLWQQLDALGPAMLPDSEAVLPKGVSAETATATLDQIAAEVLTPKTLFAVVENARQLQEHPERSVVMDALTNPEVKAALAQIVADGRTQSEQRWTEMQEKMLAILPAQAVLGLAQQRENAEGMLARLFDGGDVVGALSKLGQQPINEGVANISNALLSFNKSEPPPPARPQDHAQMAALHDSPPGQLDGMKTLTSFALLGEASLEFLIGYGAHLMSADIDEHLQMVSDSLSALKKEREAVGKRINALGGGILAQQMAVRQQSQKAVKLADAMILLAAAGALFAVAIAVIAVVVAIAVLIAVCSYGTCSWVSALLICCAIAVVVGAVGMLAVTILLNLSPLMKGLAVILKYMGLQDESKKISEIEALWYDNVASKDWFIYGCIAAMLIFGIIGAVGALANPSFWWLTVIQMCVALGSAAVKLGMVVGNYVVATEMAKVQRALSMLAAENQRLASKLGELHLELQKLRAMEQDETSRAESLEATREHVMTNMQKAADSLGDLRQAVAGIL